MALKTELLVGQRALDECSNLWRNLEERIDPPPFQSFAWAECWLEHLGSQTEPWIIVVGDPPKGLFPLALRKIGVARILVNLGDGVSDYLGPLLSEVDDAVVGELGARLVREAHRFDLLDLRSLYLEEGPRRTFSDALGGTSAERLHNRCPAIDTLGSWDTYLQERRPKFRANLKRASRRVQGHGEKVEAQLEHGTPELFEEMEEVERESWKWEHGAAYLRLPRQNGFLRDVLLESPVRHEVWTCRIDDVLAAFAVVFRNSTARFYYLPSFRNRFTDTGSYLLGEIVRDCFETEVEECDLLQGDEPYKQAWTTHERRVYEVGMPGGGVVGKAAMLSLKARWRLAHFEHLRRLHFQIRTWESRRRLE